VAHISNPDNWIVVAITLLVVMGCIGVHYEVLSHCSRYLPIVSPRRRRRVLFLIMIILLTHVVEMWLFAFGYHLLVNVWGLGSLVGGASLQLPDLAYYSAMVYTTVGFGDVVPSGPIRFMTGMEALTGLVMITWSASFTYLEMQRDWPPGDPRRSRHPL
jgi:hypothetical protein